MIDRIPRAARPGQQYAAWIGKVENVPVRIALDIARTLRPYGRIRIRARGPRTAPSVLAGRGPRGYDQDLPMEHARRVTVYVYPRSR